MEFFLQKRIDSLQKAYINPPKPCGALFMMDECTFLGFKISTTIHCHSYSLEEPGQFLI